LTLFIHPIVALLTVFILYLVGVREAPALWGAVMFAIVVVAFFAEALIARRLISKAVHDPTINAVQRQTATPG
jgi:hypothetical protein